jgi:hypothetical protein
MSPARFEPATPVKSFAPSSQSNQDFQHFQSMTKSLYRLSYLWSSYMYVPNFNKTDCKSKLEQNIIILGCM